MRPVADAPLPFIMAQGVDASLRSYRALKRSPNYGVSEAQRNALGHQFLGMKEIGEAMAIVKLNVEAYPQSANVYDSFGKAYMVSGDKEIAIENYQKAVELDPQNINAMEMLKKLRTQ